MRRCAKPGGQGQGFRGLPTTEAQIPPTSPISSASKRRVTPGRLHGLSRDPEHCRPAHKLGTVELGPLNQETYTRTPSPRGHDSSTRKSRSPLSLHVSTDPCTFLLGNPLLMRQNPLPSRSRPSFRIHGAREGPGSWPRWAPAAKENTQTGNQHFHSLLWPASHFFPCLKHQGSPGPRYPDGAPGASAQALPSARKASYPLTARPGTHPAAAAVPRLAHVLGHLVTLVEAHGHGVAQSHGCLQKRGEGMWVSSGGVPTAWNPALRLPRARSLHSAIP